MESVVLPEMREAGALRVGEPVAGREPDALEFARDRGVDPAARRVDQVVDLAVGGSAR
jgi:hypothetical protein